MRRILKLLVAMSFSGLACQAATAYEIVFSYAGVVDQVVRFSDEALPYDLATDAPVEGSIRFDTSSFVDSTFIRGSLGAGNGYEYLGSLAHSLSIGDLLWSVDSGTLSLMEYHRATTPYQAIDVYSTARSAGQVLSFPGLLDNRELGVAFIDSVPELALLSSTDLARAVFDQTEYSRGSGHVTTRAFGSNGDITDGYYIHFRVNRLEVAINPIVIDVPPLVPIPTPSTMMLLLAAVMGGLAIRHRDR